MGRIVGRVRPVQDLPRHQRVQHRGLCGRGVGADGETAAEGEEEAATEDRRVQAEAEGKEEGRAGQEQRRQGDQALQRGLRN